MNRRNKLKVPMLAILSLTLLLPGCGANSVTQTFKEKPEIAVYYLGADTSRLEPDEVETFNKMALEMTNNLIEEINKWGFEATLLETQQGTFSYADKGYLLRFSLTPHRMISNTTRSLIGVVAGPNIIEDHFEFIDLKNKKMLTWGKYTKDSEQPMDVLLQRKNDAAIFKMDAYIHRQ